MAVRLCLPRHARPLSMLLVKRWCAKQDSNLHCTPSEGAASCHLGYWRIRGEQTNGARTRGSNRQVRAKWRARGALQVRDIDGQAGQYEWCRLRESNTHVPLYEGGALPGSAKPAKGMNGQRRAPRKRKRPCNRDYRSKQSAAPLANSGRSRCQTAKRNTSTLAEAMRFGVELGHVLTSSQPPRFTRAALLPASWRDGMNPARRIACSNAPGQAETVACFESFGPFGPSCLFGGGLAHRRISPVFSTRYRVASLGMRTRHARARRRNRPVAYSTGR